MIDHVIDGTRDVLIALIVAAAILALCFWGFQLEHTQQVNDATVKIEQQKTEQTRIDACTRIEDQATRTLCLTQTNGSKGNG